MLLEAFCMLPSPRWIIVPPPRSLSIHAMRHWNVVVSLVQAGSTGREPVTELHKIRAVLCILEVGRAVERMILQWWRGGLLRLSEHR